MPDTLHPALRPYPSKLFVETTSRCNLSCAMCVKQTDTAHCSEGDLSADLFNRLEPVFPHLEALILNGVGEPLLHSELENFVARARQGMPAASWIGFQSNGLLLTDERALALATAGLDRICLSVDSISPETFKRMRQGGELPAIDAAFAALAKAKRTSGRDDLQVGAEIVLTRNNLTELPDTLEWAAKRGATFAIVTHLLPYDQKHADQAAYLNCTEDAIEHFRQWKSRAAQEGVELDRYFDILFKFSKSPEEKRIVDFVERMKSAAAERELFLDLSKLFAIDHDWLANLNDILEKARQVAAQTGLDLRLPEIVPKDDRKCHFVEDGGAFISWEGEVHPCYFLWHRYNCFASGWDQKVRPRTFGDLKSETLQAIWNNQEFSAFRKSVISYDYPFCISCRLAPCDYVQTEEFEQDCHVKGEPCGSCLWCMGLFQCLR
jgi:putative metalloenzyme radical SAM/SPASM domain maturase